VNKVLQEIGSQDIPQVLVFNRLICRERLRAFKRDEYGRIARIF